MTECAPVAAAGRGVFKGGLVGGGLKRWDSGYVCLERTSNNKLTMTTPQEPQSFLLVSLLICFRFSLFSFFFFHFFIFPFPALSPGRKSWQIFALAE